MATTFSDIRTLFGQRRSNTGATGTGSTGTSSPGVTNTYAYSPGYNAVNTRMKNDPFYNFTSDRILSSDQYYRSLPSLTEQLSNAGSAHPYVLYSAGRPLATQGYANLLNLLVNQGRTDPGMMNAQTAAIQRDTQGAQQQMQGMLQARGFQNSGVGQAIQAALGAAGVGKQADIRNQDAQMAEQRRRQDLQLLNDLVFGPSMDYTAMALGQYNADRTNKQNQQNALIGALGTVLGGLICWVAREVYGQDNPRWMMFRTYVMEIAPAWFRKAYIKYGERFAAWIADKPLLKKIIRNWMDRVIAKHGLAQGA